MQSFTALRTWWSDRILAMRRDRRRTMLLGVLYLLAIGYVDYATGYEINLTVVYITPLIMLTVAGGWRVGLAAVLACALVTEMADYLAGRRYDQSIYHVYSFISHSLSYFSFLFIITQLLVLYDQERDVAGHDILTGLLNRRGFLNQAQERLHRAASEHAQWNLHGWDVVGFREINTRYGHDRADALLMTIADALSNGLPQEALLARLGADRYFALVPSVAHAPAVAEQGGERSTQGQSATFGDSLTLCAEVAAARLELPVALRHAAKALPPRHRTANEVASEVDALLDAAKAAAPLTCRPAPPDAADSAG